MEVSVEAPAGLKQDQAPTQPQEPQPQTQSLGRAKTVKAFKSLKFKNLNLRKQSEPQDLTKDVIQEDEPTASMAVTTPFSFISEAEATTAEAAATAGANLDAAAARVRVIPNQESLLARVYYDFEAGEDDDDEDYGGMAGHDDEFQVTKYSSLRPRMMKLSR